MESQPHGPSLSNGMSRTGCRVHSATRWHHTQQLGKLKRLNAEKYAGDASLEEGLIEAGYFKCSISVLQENSLLWVHGCCFGW